MFKFIPKNVGRLDQIIRLGICTGMIYIGFFNEEIIKDEFSSILLGGIGVALMYTVVMRSCPLYILIGWSSCPKDCATSDEHNSSD